MEFSNPTIDPPLFALPAHVYRSASPSPSPSRSSSPLRHSRNFSQSFDPLARDFSPTRTLRAFTSTPGTPLGKSEATLVRLIENASSSERQFGTRIAQTCKDIRTWHDELLAWPWGDSFEPPPDAQDDNEGPYWGSLRENRATAYEQRVHDIREALYDQDVDALKDYVLAQHTQPKSDHDRLDDFTALTTATILHALPYLSRLDRLLNTWSIRLAVLRKVPSYLTSLDQVKSDLNNAWADMAQRLGQHRDAQELRREFQATKEQLEMRMGKTGGRLDAMLDDLEGREETVPDAWIDAFESLEATYSEWLTQTERHIIQQSLQHAHPVDKSKMTQFTSREIASAAAESSDQDAPNSSHTFPQLLSSAEAEAKAPTSGPHVSTQSESFGAPIRPAESPVLGGSPASLFPDTEGGDSESDSVNKASRDIPGAYSFAPKNNSNNESLQRAGSLKSLSPSTISRSRHVPITVDYNEKDASPRIDGTPDPATESPSFPTSQSSLPSGEPVPSVTNNKVRARAALLNGGIEQTQSLQKSVNSPVRSFEHASMAFTKLFNKTNAAAQSRSSSISSQASTRKGLGLGIKHHEGFRTFHRSASIADGSSANKHSATSQQLVASPPAPRHSSSPVRGSGVQISPRHERIPSDARSTRSSQGMYVTPEIQQDFFPSTQESKSTIDTSWSSPALSGFRDNWPLPVAVQNEDEISSPRSPMDSNVFEKMFVDSFPGSPEKSRRSSREQEGDPLDRFLAFTSKPRGSKEPLIDDTMITGSNRRRSKSSTSPVGAKSNHRSRSSATSLTFAPITELPTPSSFEATPEVQDARTASYFRAKKVQSSPGKVPPANLGSSGRHEIWSSWARDVHPLPSPFEFEAVSLKGNDFGDTSQDENETPVIQRRVSKIKRASITSIENHSRSELNTINISDLSRRTSVASRQSSRRTEDRSSETPRVSHDRSDSALVQEGGSPHPNLQSDSESIHAADVFGASEPPPQSLNLPKRRRIPDLVPSSSTSDLKTANLRNNPSKKHARKESGAEQLDRHVSRVLNDLPSRIVFKPSLSESTIDQSSASSTPAGVSRPRPSLATRPSRPGLTLAAAQPDTMSQKSSSVDSDVKLYHLTQEGRDNPIKLFVRLVGDGERVMVRVGGGWADLGEYLRQYADHHKHRTFSDGKLEVAPAAAHGGSFRVGAGTKARTPLSRPGSAVDRPGSSMSIRTSRSSFGAANVSNDVNSSPSASSQIIDITTPVHARNGYITPGGSVKSTSRPSTADTFANPSPSSWSGVDIGLAGPATKRGGGLDEQKSRWVEEMIGRAKQASAEKKKGDERAWGDMGKVGGTRRMVFKHQNSEN